MRQLLSLGLAEAEKAIAAGIEAAKRLDRPMAFAVADVGAEMIATARMDGASPRILRHSIRKAYTAALMCRHTLAFQPIWKSERRASSGAARSTTLHAASVAAGRAFVGVLGAGGGGPHDETSRASCCRHVFEIVETSAMTSQYLYLPLAKEGSPSYGPHRGLAHRHRSSPGRPGSIVDGHARSPEKQFELAFQNLLALRSCRPVPMRASFEVFFPTDQPRLHNNYWLKLFSCANRPARRPPGLCRRA